MQIPTCTTRPWQRYVELASVSWCGCWGGVFLRTMLSFNTTELTIVLAPSFARSFLPKISITTCTLSCGETSKRASSHVIVSRPHPSPKSTRLSPAAPLPPSCAHTHRTPAHPTNLHPTNLSTYGCNAAHCSAIEWQSTSCTGCERPPGMRGIECGHRHPKETSWAVVVWYQDPVTR